MLADETVSSQRRFMSKAVRARDELIPHLVMEDDSIAVVS